ncbi:hypothetical protein Cob_v008237 [Colletotrichum orbiculare MAFF 240422]|uniref:Uncharacterized protein n=1 Tax=Colletotrichum orbiculare (strain 104-T / ATCC 96160 / CBS 514.97 / LARS 414 / MAFF 240422) TaxID=1213857 RepID=N4VVL4_COLOR|nr:hypothetical protein Cob_v008237 [Colletotrichum orbiculare MAFF 240422]
MTRIYSRALRCVHCGNTGSFGWLYRCSQDREEMLRDRIAAGSDVFFDDLGRQLVTTMGSRPRGPEKRVGNAACFLEEMSPNDIVNTYSCDQLMILFNQRKHLDNVFRQEHIRMRTSAARQCHIYTPEDAIAHETTAPWIPTPNEECKYTLCHSCREPFVQRTYTSLDGVVNGDAPATAVAGFGFHLLKERPVSEANIVANLGLRPAPAPVRWTTSSPGGTSRGGTAGGIRSRLARQLVSQMNVSSTAQNVNGIRPYPIPPRQLPRSPGSANLATQAVGDSADVDTPIQAGATASIILPSAATGSLSEEVTTMEEHEKEEGKFFDKPLKVPKGVAVLEESVEMHVPDIITQV